jgi:AcrR family transcriptional regulator
MEFIQVKIKSRIKNPYLLEGKRKEISEAAYPVFVNKGFKGTRVEDVANALKIDKRNLYNYIGAKEDLLFLVFCYFLPMFSKRIIQSTLNITNPVEKLKAAIIENFKITEEYQDFVLLITRELRYLKKSLISEVLHLSRQNFLIYEEILNEGKGKGIFVFDNAKILSFAIVSMIHMRANSRWELNRFTLQESVDQVLSFVLRGIIKVNHP